MSRTHARRAPAGWLVMSGIVLCPFDAGAADGDAGTTTLVKVTITGTRLPAAAAPAAQDVRVYDRERIERSGQSTVSDFLATVPEVSLASPENATIATTVRLRGSLFGSPLVLINGRRTQPVAGGVGSFSYFDLNTIPLSLVERIEMLPSGSSAIYGGDALVGVVNLVLRSDFTGTEGGVGYKWADKIDETLIWAGGGWKPSEDFSFSMMARESHRGPLLGKDREITSATPEDSDSALEQSTSESRAVNQEPGDVQPEPPRARPQTITITGSRLITQDADSSSPLISITTQDILRTHPTTVFEGLLDLPVFAGSTGAAASNPGGAGGSNNNLSALNLRGLGAIRTLVLWDGRRLGPSQQNGFVDANMVPQMLLRRVDIATGGASAVYGSDAISGVVNFITDTGFNGVRVEAQGGAAQQGQLDRSHNLGVAFGTNLFGGNGHFEGSIQQHYRDGVPHRDEVAQFRGHWTVQGNGCPGSGQPCQPYFLTPNATISNTSFGGRINGPANNPFNDYQFAANGVLTPFVNGVRCISADECVTNSTIQIGGSGAYVTSTSLIAQERLDQLFGRFDFDLAPDVRFNLTAAYTKDNTFNWWLDNSTGPVTMSVSDAFLPAPYSSAMAAAGLSTFTFNKQWGIGGIPPQAIDFDNRNLIVDAGLDGNLGGYRWSAHYRHTLADMKSRASNIVHNGRLYAAMDAAVSPANGQIVCRATLSGSYPGCVPINLFGPTAESAEAVAYVTDIAEFRVRLPQDDFAASISGAPIEGWAGPINTALSMEGRRLGYRLDSSAPPATTAPLDCAGLAFNCRPGSTNQYSVATASRPPVSQTVVEEALEVEVPLLKGVPFARAVNLDAAYRHAGYRVNGNGKVDEPSTTHTFSANTWKLGMVWHLDDAWTVRATRSRDFRAPTLNDLFTPVSVMMTSGFADLLTGVTPNAQQVSGGNPTLQPETAYTSTLGAVFNPTPKLSVSADAYYTTIKNAILTVSGFAAQIQQACYASGGSSPYCPLIQRTGGYTDTARTNTVTAWLQQGVNAALEKTWGGDFEVNWATRLADRPLALRFLAAYQPHIKYYQEGVNTLDYAATVNNTAGVFQAGAVWRATGYLRYSPVENFAIDWATLWRSPLHVSNDPQLSALPSTSVPSVAFSNATLSYRLGTAGKGKAEVYLNIQNVFDRKAPIASFPGTAAQPGLFGGYVVGDNPLGRYFNLGVRFEF